VVSKPMLGALLTSIAYKQCDSSLHLRTDELTKNPLNLRGSVTKRILRGKGQNA
jgi:hypothetical protein